MKRYSFTFSSVLHKTSYSTTVTSPCSVTVRSTSICCRQMQSCFILPSTEETHLFRALQLNTIVFRTPTLVYTAISYVLLQSTL